MVIGKVVSVMVGEGKVEAFFFFWFGSRKPAGSWIDWY